MKNLNVSENHINTLLLLRKIGKNFQQMSLLLGKLQFAIFQFLVKVKLDNIELNFNRKFVIGMKMFKIHDLILKWK